MPPSRDSVLRATGLIVGGAASLALVAAAALDLSRAFWGLAWLSAPAVGALVVWRRPRNRIGWLLLGSGGLIAAVNLEQAYVASTAGPGPVHLEVLVAVVSPLAYVMLIQIALLFPSGVAAGRFTRVLSVVAWAIGAAVCLGELVGEPLQYAQAGNSGRPNPWSVDALAPAASFLVNDTFLLVPLLMLSALAALALRWRRSSSVERLQYQWFWFGTCLTALTALLSLLPSTSDEASVLTVVLILATFNALPVSIGIAVTRYHLFDIDRVVSRTTSYVVVTVLLLAVYATSVTAAGRLIEAAAGGDGRSAPPLAVAAATLVAAALARPMLRLVQNRVDRRFNRAKYDAQRTLESFAGRLRSTVHPEQVQHALVEAVYATVQPVSLGTWVASAEPDDRPGGLGPRHQGALEPPGVA